MKKLGLFFIFMLTLEAHAADCPLTPERRLELIKSQPYPVDDLYCDGDSYVWTISNRRYLTRIGEAPVIKPIAKIKTPAPVEYVELQPVQKKIVFAPKPPKAIIKQTPKVVPQKIAVKEEAPKKTIEQKKPSRAISWMKGLNEWNTSAGFGANYLQMSQDGSFIQNANVSATLWSNFRFHSEFIFENWSAWINLATYKFKYAVLTKKDTESINTFEVGGSYKWFVASLASEGTPIFNDLGSTVEVTSVNVLYASLGVKKDYELPALSETYLRLKGLARLPVSSGSSDTKIKADSVSGFGLLGRAELSREIYNKVNHSLRLSCMTDLSYQNLSQDIKWDTQSGNVKSSVINASVTFGLLFSLK